MIVVSLVVKCCVATWLMTDLYVAVHKTGVSECIEAVEYFRKENVKDDKKELGRMS